MNNTQLDHMENSMSDRHLNKQQSYNQAIIERPVAALMPYARNARTHSKKQIQQIASSIERFGFVNPVLVSDDGIIIAGHGRVEAAKLLGHKTVPTLALSHLGDVEM
jgi:ParB-like chromosome segregation protein Spo0J